MKVADEDCIGFFPTHLPSLILSPVVGCLLTLVLAPGLATGLG
jgi:hypothetical protein